MHPIQEEQPEKNVEEDETLHESSDTEVNTIETDICDNDLIVEKEQ